VVQATQKQAPVPEKPRLHVQEPHVREPRSNDDIPTHRPGFYDDHHDVPAHRPDFQETSEQKLQRERLLKKKQELELETALLEKAIHQEIHKEDVKKEESAENTEEPAHVVHKAKLHSLPTDKTTGVSHYELLHKDARMSYTHSEPAQVVEHFGGVHHEVSKLGAPVIQPASAHASYTHTEPAQVVGHFGGVHHEVPKQGAPVIKPVQAHASYTHGEPDQRSIDQFKGVVQPEVPRQEQHHAL